MMKKRKGSVLTVVLLLSIGMCNPAQASVVKKNNINSVTFGPGMQETSAEAVKEEKKEWSMSDACDGAYKIELNRFGNPVFRYQVPGVSEYAEAGAFHPQFTLKNEEISLEEERKIRDFYQDTVLVGDSIAAGLGVVAMSRPQDPFCSGLKSLAVAGYDLESALYPEMGGAQPLYRGVSMPIWQSVNLAGAKHILMFFGYKNMEQQDPSAMYAKLALLLQQTNPGADIILVSAIYMHANAETGPYTSEHIRRYNALMKEYAAAFGWNYIDIAEHFSDRDGTLSDQCSSDKAFHLTTEATLDLITAMKEYALSK